MAIETGKQLEHAHVGHCPRPLTRLRNKTSAVRVVRKHRTPLMSSSGVNKSVGLVSEDANRKSIWLAVHTKRWSDFLFGRA